MLRKLGLILELKYNILIIETPVKYQVSFRV